jgi:ATP-dependent DNA ligase
VYEVFDLLHLDGRSLLDEPLEERRRLLAGALAPTRASVSASTSRATARVLRGCAVRGLEGIMAKDRGSPYLPGKRAMRWQKVKIRPSRSWWSVA